MQKIVDVTSFFKYACKLVKLLLLKLEINRV